MTEKLHGLALPKKSLFPALSLLFQLDFPCFVQDNIPKTSIKLHSMDWRVYTSLRLDTKQNQIFHELSTANQNAGHRLNLGDV